MIVFVWNEFTRTNVSKPLENDRQKKILKNINKSKIYKKWAEKNPKNFVTILDANLNIPLSIESFAQYHTTHSPSTFHQNLSIKDPLSNIKTLLLCEHTHTIRIYVSECACVLSRTRSISRLSILYARRHSTQIVSRKHFFFIHCLLIKRVYSYVYGSYKTVLFYWPLLQEFWWKTRKKFKHNLYTRSRNGAGEKLSVKFTWYNFVRTL